ncbi:MAG: hypothetical protein CVU84_14635 [Firmicutes bacterium HGW-Firmicutes-1]|nr:MAG: hypothetical protein CVU84_14635 [Firmicutes bacterium HGW-Firmicutes-1]
MREVCIISHSGDPDGIFSQALLLKHTRNAVSRIHSFMIENDEIIQLLKRDEIRNCSELYIADLPLNEAAITDSELLELLSDKDLYYYDHHYLSNSRDNLLKNICKVYLREEAVCAAKIISRVLFPLEPYPEFVSEIAQACDFNIINDRFWVGQKLRRIISVISIDERDELVDDIIRGTWFDGMNLHEKYVAKESEANKLEKAAIMFMNEMTELFEIKDYKFAISYASQILYMKPGLSNLAVCNPQCDAVIVLYEGKSDVLLTAALGINANAIPILEYCVYKGGGGRNNAGGYKLEKEKIISRENYLEIKNHIIKDFTEYLKTIEFEYNY